MSRPRSALLAELGLVRYRLRPTTGGPAMVRAPSAGSTAAPGRLRLYVPGADAAPADGAAAKVWAAVLAWLGVSPAQIDWLPVHAGAIELPVFQRWCEPGGKRAIWQALKPYAARGN